MRWCLFIPTLLILLMLGMEQSGWCAALVVKGSAPLVCVLDDDETEFKQDLVPEHPLSECDPLAAAGWQGMSRQISAGWVAVLKEAACWEIHLGIRRHRWLCQERC
ncbi:hypothetical protein [Prosthecobacter vanneervenii]|uniref:Uncharacterized protein n=1 Tax=Prosthecobacter vanneervenii TaxID=48466 RepID=A0A7W7Y750_9BACT|nr:hypothetical protein [Prosthecobacter vanneervenii]MBB5030856.1 hypothetical protein [Prosthecobacter vanneervenii]